MEPLLFLAHRIPYPPNKGDKIRSYHLLRYLAERYRVYLGCFVDSRDDLAQGAVLRSFCTEVCAIPLDPRRARFRSVAGFLTGEALSLPYYRSRRLQAWIDDLVRREPIRSAVAYSSPMAQYLRPHPQLRAVVDLVDVDSEKWRSYAENRPWPLSAVYRREGKHLLSFERDVVARSAAGVLVTRAEAQLFGRLAPECSARVHVIENGVDSEYFAPSGERGSPFTVDESPVVFTGAMDYWPNVDAVMWFTREVLPRIRAERPEVRFYVVGMNPTPAVRALGSDPAVVVTGKVDDVRPYVQHASVVVAPLRIARGVQNKVLEAMAMARPVVVTSIASEGLRGAGHDFLFADSAESFADAVVHALDRTSAGEFGRLARRRVISDYSWRRNLAAFEHLLRDAPLTETAAVG